MSNFIDQFHAGKAQREDIDDFIDAWHRSNSLLSLSSFLGMTSAQYQQWVERPTAFFESLTPIKTPVPMLDAHKKSVFRYWKTQQEEKPETFDTDANAMIPDAMQWLGIFEDQLPGVTPGGARCVLLDWRTNWLVGRETIP